MQLAGCPRDRVGVPLAVNRSARRPFQEGIRQPVGPMHSAEAAGVTRLGVRPWVFHKIVCSCS